MSVILDMLVINYYYKLQGIILTNLAKKCKAKAPFGPITENET